jgi:hypothetical protein
MTPEQLVDIEEIKQLKARYCRFIDTKQWDRLAGLFTADVRFDGFGSAPTGADAGMFISGISKRLANAVAIHHVQAPEISLTGPYTARGIWSMMDYLEFPADGPGPREVPGSRGFMGYGHYEEEYRKEGGVWKFSFLRLTRMRMDPLPADHPLPRPGFLAATPRWL